MEEPNMPNLDDVKLPLPSSLQQIVGALLFGADHPLTIPDIRACLSHVAEQATEANTETLKIFAEASPREVTDALKGIEQELERIGLGIEVVELNGGYRFQTQACCGRWVRDLLKVERPNRLSRPALETLAIGNDRQPVAKSEIESIRGVMIDHILKALMELHLVRIVGRSDLPGRPFLYGTTATFLEHFGLRSLDELNALDPTLQRSKASERKAMHKKEKKETPVPTVQPELLVEPDVAAVKEILGSQAEPVEPLYET
jgi:segregation and condensation protein B